MDKFLVKQRCNQNRNADDTSDITGTSGKKAKPIEEQEDITPLIWESDVARENDDISSGNESQTSEEHPATSSLQESEILSVPNEAAGMTSQNVKGPNDISQTTADHPCQPCLTVYPQTLLGGKKRGFNKEWYKSYSWIEYSISKDAVFCYACRHFSVHNKPLEPTFVVDGYRNWRKATGKDGGLAKHERSHKTAMQTWVEFKLRAKTGTTVTSLQNEEHHKLTSENRHYLKAIVKVLRLTATQKIAQRGHREGESSSNKGNFLEILHLIAEYDDILQSRLNGPRNARYTHPSIQNELLKIMAKMVRSQIREDIKQAGYFSIQVDETKDISRKEQISIVLRYFLNGEIREEFLHFKEANGLDAESIFNVIKETLSNCQIDINRCVGQCYDGASVMKGANAGVQAKFRGEVPQAVYTHCFAHRLNLTLVDCLKIVNKAHEFLAVLQKLYVFLSSSYTHIVFLKNQGKVYPNRRPIELKRLSDTRWACQYASCVALDESLAAVIFTLNELEEENDKERAVEAKGLLTVLDGNFVVGLVVLKHILCKTKTLSDQLQSKDLDLAAAVDLVKAVISDLEEARSNPGIWQALWDKIEKKCNENGIPLISERRARKRKVPARLADSVVTTTTGVRNTLSESDEYRVHFYYAVVDTLLGELHRRFSSSTCVIMTGVGALSPKSTLFLQYEALREMSAHYGCVDEDLKCELHQARKLLARKEARGINVSSITVLAQLLFPYREAFYELYKLVCIALTLSVSSAGCERSFSCLKMQKNYLRNSSGEGRTSDLAVLAINHERTMSLNLDEIVNKFACSHKNARITLI